MYHHIHRQHYDKIWFPSSFGHNRNEDVCTKSTHKTESNIETQNITWKTHNSGKNHDSPRAVEYTIWEEYKVEENTEATTSCLLLHHTRRRLQDGGNDLSLSLSASLSLTHALLHALYNSLYKYVTTTTSYTYSMCPKSYLYIYDFRAIYINVHSNRLDRSGPVLSSAGSLHLPSGGTCFPTEPRGQFLLLMSMSMPIAASSHSSLSPLPISIPPLHSYTMCSTSICTEPNCETTV